MRAAVAHSGWYEWIRRLPMDVIVCVCGFLAYNVSLGLSVRGITCRCEHIPETDNGKHSDTAS